MALTFTPTVVPNPIGVQGDYPLEMDLGIEGAIADLQAYVSRSFRNQSGAVIPFGALVSTDNTPTTNDQFAVELANTAGLPLVVGLASHVNIFETSAGGTYPTNPASVDAAGRPGYPNLQTVSVISKGVVWVYAVGPVALHDPVRYFGADATPGTPGGYIGRWGTAAVATRTSRVTAGARWLSETAVPGLVQLEIDIPTLIFATVD